MVAFQHVKKSAGEVQALIVDQNEALVNRMAWRIAGPVANEAERADVKYAGIIIELDSMNVFSPNRCLGFVPFNQSKNVVC